MNAYLHMYLINLYQPLGIGAAIIVKRSAHVSAGGFNERIIIGEDHEYSAIFPVWVFDTACFGPQKYITVHGDWKKRDHGRSFLNGIASCGITYCMARLFPKWYSMSSGSIMNNHEFPSSG